jgi:restriction system protein
VSRPICLTGADAGQSIWAIRASSKNKNSTLDNRQNLMELSPAEFESLITNLFQRMGLDTKLTQPSRDGGVDCVAFDCRPILGGKVVIQAKR